MISIVAHGIMGTSYRQDIVVDEGVTENGSILVLNDIRRQLSSLYGDDTPMTGWALQPASCGIWMSRIERAFDSNYIPAYVMVSFLIPLGKHLPSTATQIIEHSLVVNHSKFMQQSVVLHKPDWGFLHVLGRELEGMLDDATPVIPYEWKEGNGAACFTGDVSSMLANLWDSRFLQYKIIYCGNRILSADKEFPSLDDNVHTDEGSGFCGDSKTFSQDSSEENLTNNELEFDNIEDVTLIENEIDEEVVEDSASDSMDIGYDADSNNRDVGTQSFQETTTDNAISSYKQNHNSSEQLLSNAQKNVKKSGRNQKRSNDLINNISIIVGIVAVFFLIYIVIAKTQNPQDGTDYWENTDTVEVIDCIDVEENASIVECTEKKVEDITGDVLKHDIPTPEEVHKINISSANKLFLCLTWDNVKDNGRSFYAKYEVTESSLIIRADNIIKQANKIGKDRYVKGYLNSENESDRLHDLENYIRLCNDLDSYNELIKEDAKEKAPEFGLG